MTTFNIHEAKTHLSRLADQAASGDSFVIAKAGKPMVKVTALDAPATPKRVGFLTGEIDVPKNFDCMGSDAIAAMFWHNFRYVANHASVGSHTSSPKWLRAT